MPSKKPFAWSYSAFSRFKTCPKQYEQINVLRNVKDSYNEASQWGARAHVELANALRFRRLPKDSSLQSMASILKAMWAIDAKILGVEEKQAFSRDWMPLSDFFHPDTWVRVVFDCYIVRNDDPSKGIVLDWKTGKPKQDLTQMYLYAKALMSMYDYVDVVNVVIGWVQISDIEKQTVTRKQVDFWWENRMSKDIEAMEAAYSVGEYEPKRSGLCGKWCPVTSKHCPFGKEV